MIPHAQYGSSKTRRSDGEGSKPYQRKDGRWQINLRISDTTTGKPIRKAFTSKNRAAAVAKAQRCRNDLSKGMLAEPNRTTFEGWMRHWLEEIAKPRLGHQTWKGNSSTVRKWVFDTTEGAVGLEELKPVHLKRIYGRMRKAGRSETTILNVHRILSKALKDAVVRGMLGSNPAAKIDAPTAADFEPLVLTSDKARELIQDARADKEWGTNWIFYLAFGPRQAERLGLCREDLDFERGVLSFERQLVNLCWGHGCPPGPSGEPSCGRKRGGNCPARHGGGWHLLKTKTKTSKRQWAMPDAIAQTFRRQLNIQERWKIEEGPNWKPFIDQNGNERHLVFTRRDGSPIPAAEELKAWKKFTARHGIEGMRGHDARHTAATILLELGVHPRVVMDLMGWSQISMVTRYQYVMDSMRQDVSASLAETLLRPAEPTEPEASVIDLAARRARRQG